MYFCIFIFIKNQKSKIDMDTAVLESNVYAETWTNTVKTEKKKSFEEAVAECDGVSVDDFFDELDRRIKKRFNA
jgi:hypothetical protein